MEGLPYSGSGHDGNGNPGFDGLGVGDKVLVSYDPLSPSVSVLGDAKQLLWGEELSVGMAAVILPTFLVGILYAKGVLPRYRRIPEGDA